MAADREPDAVRVLYVDDSRFDRDLVRNALGRDARFRLTEAASRGEFERLLAGGGFDVVLSDFDILGFDGLQVLDAVRAHDPRLPVVILTGTGSEEVAVQALQKDASDYVIKSPQRIQRLAPTIDAAIERARLRREREEAALRLAESERRLRVAVDSLPESFVIYDADLRFRFVNAFMLAALGCAESDVVGRRDEELFDEGIRAAYMPMLLRAVETRSRQSGEITIARESRRTDLILTYVPLLGADGALREVLGFAYDVTTRKAYEAELSRLYEAERESRARLEALSRRLVALQEEERRSIARELHDEIGQLLTGLKLLIGGADPRAAQPELERLVGELMQRVRNLSMDLRPVLLDDLGLVPALLWHIDRYSAQTRVRVDFRHEALARRLPSAIETAAYRIVQEALTNVARHSGAAEAMVVLRAESDCLSVLVEDAGAGFAVGRVLAIGACGLTGMRERALLLGGRLEVESAPGTGTRVRAELPLDAPETREER